MDPAHRAVGIGSELMQRMFAELKARGCDNVILHVGLQNEAAGGCTNVSACDL